MLSVDSNISIIQCLETLASQLKTINFQSYGEQERLQSQLTPHIGLLQEVHTGLAILNNFCQPIKRLPIEILGDILKQTFPHPKTSLDGSFRHDTFSMLPPQTNVFIRHAISLSSVCRLWRDVVSLHPTFWAVIETHKSRSSHPQSCIDYFLPRTLGVPLRILDYNYSAWDVLQSNSRRLRQYNLVVNAVPPVALSQTPISAPALESLSVSLLGDELFLAIDPLSLFAPGMPGLKRLLLRDVVSWADHQFTGLTHLALCADDTPDQVEYQFLDVLRSSPLLQSLVIQHWLPSGCWDGLGKFHDDREVRLDHLSQLIVSQQSKESVMCLVSHLTFPPTTSVIMTAEELVTIWRHPSTIPQGAPDFGNKSTLLLIREPPPTSHGYIGDEHPVLISAYNEGDATKLMFFCPDLLSEQGPPSTEIPSSVATILSMLNPAHVENLFLDTCPHTHLPNLARLFQTIPSLKVFSFQCQDFKECLRSLRQVEATQFLETVRIVYEHCTPYGWNLYDESFMADLGAMITHRARSGRRLKAIYFDIVQAPDSKQGDKLREEHTIFLKRCNRFLRDIDVLETQYHSSKWSGDAGLHAEYEYTSWVRDWDLGI